MRHVKIACVCLSFAAACSEQTQGPLPAEPAAGGSDSAASDAATGDRHPDASHMASPDASAEEPDAPPVRACDCPMTDYCDQDGDCVRKAELLISLGQVAHPPESRQQFLTVMYMTPTGEPLITDDRTTLGTHGACTAYRFGPGGMGFVIESRCADWGTITIDDEVLPDCALNAIHLSRGEAMGGMPLFRSGTDVTIAVGGGTDVPPLSVDLFVPAELQLEHGVFVPGEPLTVRIKDTGAASSATLSGGPSDGRVAIDCTFAPGETEITVDGSLTGFLSPPSPIQLSVYSQSMIELDEERLKVTVVANSQEYVELELDP
jgi:hypothetical protein